MSKKVIEIKGLNFSYPDGRKALKDINLDVFEGESLGIIGPNGAGKSTLLFHLNGILRGSGFVRILGLDMEDKNLPLIRRKVGLVFQDPDNQLFMPTVFDDVSFGPINMMLAKPLVEKAVREALMKVGMPDCADRLSHHLSFGEKKRISIATILSMEPEIMALDEPTSNLDPKARYDLIGLLKGISKTKLIASHDLEMIFEVCGRILILNKGTVVKIAPTEEILFNHSLLRECGLMPPASYAYFSKKARNEQAVNFPE